MKENSNNLRALGKVIAIRSRGYARRNGRHETGRALRIGVVSDQIGCYEPELNATASMTVVPIMVLTEMR